LELLHQEGKLKGGMGKLEIEIWKTKNKRVVIKKVTNLSETKLHLIYEVSGIHFLVILVKILKNSLLMYDILSLLNFASSTCTNKLEGQKM